MKNSITQHLKNKSFFLIGIGGAGMMGIAELLHNMGFRVRGSDICSSNEIDRLRLLKIKISIGHDSKNIHQDDIVVFSNAIKKNNVVVIPTIIVFQDGEEIKRFQADLSFKMDATKKEVQDYIDELIMSDF